jgi:hypothetical protein
MAESAQKKPGRLDFIDWARGIGAAIMLQGHVFHSFTEPALREHSAYIYSQFVGGMPPAIFILLTGVTLAFLMDSMERKGHSVGERIIGALKRARYLLLLAVGFRLQMWLFGWPKPVDDLFKVDVLNCMGLSVALFSVLAAMTTLARMRWSLGLGIAIAGLAPLVTQSAANQLHPWLRWYVVPDVNYFGIFPWAAYLAFGLAIGSAFRVVPHHHYSRLMQWMTLLGFAVIWASQYFSNLPFSLYERSEFWLDSPALVFMKTGLILILLAFAYVWTYYIAAPGWSWIRQLGTTSLLVYWVHVELVYGRWLWFFKETLGIGQAAVAAVLVIVAMVALSYTRTNWTRLRPEWLPEAGGWFGSSTPAPRGAQGD